MLLLISKIPHFESNSQLSSANLICHSVVTDIKDTSFWKQFTTDEEGYRVYRELLLISKIPHFESNSQQSSSPSTIISGCYWYQRYLILKAIHNAVPNGGYRHYVVTDIKDTSFWKQFTTHIWKWTDGCKLLLISKIPHFESNSQHNTGWVYVSGCCYWYQRYLILKAIHNGWSKPVL